MFGLSSAVIIYIVIAVLIALLVICDLSCFIVANTGLFYAIFKCCCAKKKQNEEKLGRSHSTVMLVPTNYVTVMQMLVENLYSWRFPLPYCGNQSAGESSSHGNSSINSGVEKVGLTEMTYVFEGKDLISNGHGKKSEEENMLMINNGGKKELAVEYDVKKGTAKTGFIGKDSAV